jgi:metal-responsive CopG/Arc/MetJ family transcriptional regulator
MRRAANPTRKISITIPSRTFNALESYLSYDQSRSAFISSAIEEKLRGIDTTDISEFSNMDLLETLSYRFPLNSSEDVLIKSLLQILSK